jgi:hypothetical protein
VDTYPAADESFARLHRAGWSVDDVRILTTAGPRWCVGGSNGENAIRAEGLTQAKVWHRACEQAEAAGLLGTEPSHSRRLTPGVVGDGDVIPARG